MSDNEFEINRIFTMDSTFPSKLGDIVDTTGLPFGEVNLSESRLKNAIEKVFNKKKFDKSYWESLKEMISNPNKKFGLVAIDGFTKDEAGVDDIAIVFYMGIPRLRGRKINYLEKTYARINMRNDSSSLTFWNSYLDDENSEITHFTFASKTPVWHPHVSHSEPCLGAFAGELAQFKRDGHPIMYLNIVSQFLNTWNVRSPFWNLNHTKVKNVSDFSNKAYHTSTFTSIMNHLGKQDVAKKFREFVNKYLHKIYTPTIANDIFSLGVVYGLLEQVKHKLKNKVEKIIDRDQIHYLRGHYNDTEERRSRNGNISNWQFSILPSIHNQNRSNILIPIRIGTKEYHKSDSKIDQTVLINTPTFGNRAFPAEYHMDIKILEGLGRVMHDFYRWTGGTKIIDLLFEDIEYAIKLYSKYLAPLDTEKQILFDEMSCSGLYPHKITQVSSELKGSKESQVNRYYLEKERLVRKDHLRYARIKNMCVAYYGKELTNEFIQKCCSEEIVSHFSYEIKKNMYDDGYYISNAGLFYNLLGYHTVNDDWNKILERVNQLGEINSIETLINSYERVKERTVSMETDALIGDYDKIIRRLKEYANKTKDTNEDTQQVHLSFK